MIGAGGYVFPLTMIRDLCAFPSLRGSTISMMDVDPARLEKNAVGARTLVEMLELPTVIEATTDRRESLAGADFVLAIFQVGGLEAYGSDVEIPREYGVDQPVGDTLGPGGVFRGLRSIEVLRGLCADVQELCPDALMLNYVNPLAMTTWAAFELGVHVVGLCGAIQGTAELLAAEADVPIEECDYRAAGVNHQAWFIQFERNGEDLLPHIRESIVGKHVAGEVTDEPEGGLYAGAHERVRGELMQLTGYFHSETSHHGSEYTPWFRKDQRTVQEYLPRRWDYYDICASHDEEDYVAGFLERCKRDGLKASHEYGPSIIDSITTGMPRVVHGTVRNDGLITNLPPACAVEVPCLVDGNGVQPTHVGDLPPVCGALNRACTSVQELAVKAGLSGDRGLALAAVAMDPLTGAICTLPQIREMVERLFSAQKRWLPSFQD